MGLKSATHAVEMTTPLPDSHTILEKIPGNMLC